MSRKTRSRRRSGGFTLMEVLLVVAILIILASLATIAITRTFEGAKKNKASLDIQGIKTGINAYYLDIGSYPPSLDALEIAPEGLPNPLKWNGPYLENGVPVDPWGNPYQYTMENNATIVVMSLGRDGVAQSGDEIQ
jgi:general secretion pathway protein G